MEEGEECETNFSPPRAATAAGGGPAVAATGARLVGWMEAGAGGLTTRGLDFEGYTCGVQIQTTPGICRCLITHSVWKCTEITEKVPLQIKPKECILCWDLRKPS